MKISVNGENKIEQKEIEPNLAFIILLSVGLLCIFSFILLGFITGEWFGKWTLEPMIFFLFIGIIFLLLSLTYFFNIKENFKWAKIVRIIIVTIFAIMVIGFILSSFLITW